MCTHVSEVIRTWSHYHVLHVIASVIEFTSDVVGCIIPPARSSPLSLKVIFEQIRRGSTLDIDKCLDDEFAVNTRLMTKPDFDQAMQARTTSKVSSLKGFIHILRRFSAYLEIVGGRSSRLELVMHEFRRLLVVLFEVESMGADLDFFSMSPQQFWRLSTSTGTVNRLGCFGRKYHGAYQPRTSPKAKLWLYNVRLVCIILINIRCLDKTPGATRSFHPRYFSYTQVFEYLTCCMQAHELLFHRELEVHQDFISVNMVHFQDWCKLIISCLLIIPPADRLSCLYSSQQGQVAMWNSGSVPSVSAEEVANLFQPLPRPRRQFY